MTSAQQQATLTSANCEIAFDNLTRQLYATDASIYQIEPLAVAFPRSARQASALIQAASQAGIKINRFSPSPLSRFAVASGPTPTLHNTAAIAARTITENAVHALRGHVENSAFIPAPQGSKRNPPHVHR